MENLIIRARSGDTEAITILYEQTYSKVYYTVRSMIRNEDVIFDIMQDSYVKAFTHLEQFHGSDKFESWVKQIAANTARDWLKKKRPILFSEMHDEEEKEIDVEQQLVDDRLENLPEEVIDREETRRLIREILDELPEDQRAVIGMYYYEERSVKEIAQLMDITESAVKSRLLYGRKKIEKKVKELEKKGTRLYSLAPVPFLLWLFRSENAYAAELPDAAIRKAILENASVMAVSHSSEGKTKAGHTDKTGHTGKAGHTEKTGHTDKGGHTEKTGHTDKTGHAGKTGNIGKAGASGKSGLFLGGSAAVKIAAVAVIAVALIGGSIFGISRLNGKSDLPEETVAHVQETVESAEDSAETAVSPGTADEGETETEADAVVAPETETETEAAPETEAEGEAFLKRYRELIRGAESLDYECGEAKPTGSYCYALVTLEEGDEIPALLIAQDADDYMRYVRVFLYDAASEEVLQPTGVLLTGVAAVGGYRGDITTGEGQTQLQVTAFSSGTGVLEVSRILVSADRLNYDLIGSGTLDQEVEGVTYEDIKWFDVSDSSGIDNYSAD